MEQKIKFPRSQKVYLPGKALSEYPCSHAESRTSAQHQPSKETKK